MAYVGPGNWTKFGINLPELGLTEKLGGKKGSIFKASQNYLVTKGVDPQSAYGNGVKFTPYAQQKSAPAVKSTTDVRPPTTTNNLPTTTTDNREKKDNNDSGGGDNDNGTSLNDIINQEFDAVLADLDRQAGQAQQSIVPQRQLLGDAYQGNLNEAGLRQQNEQAALKSALNDYSQRGIARFSLTGGFGSSSGEALAERLGRYAMQEQSKLQNGYATMRNKLATSYQQGLADLEGQLQQRLSTIDSLKSRARSEKARAVFDAWKSYTDQVAQFNNTMAQYDASLRQIAAKKSGNLGLLVNNQPNFFDRKNFGIMSPIEPVGEMGTIQPGQGIPPTVYNASGGSDDEDLYNQIAGILPSTISQ